ncbi:MAG: hypothetical protein KGY80_10050 [Candidatus Thorarchaeota archaeon]|nr:hypothetical protein [Candidatus Thorarchaeota archaeon]
MEDTTTADHIRRKEIIAILAIALANVGLFFVAYIFTPILTGALAAYIIKARKRASLAAFTGSALAYIPLELIAAPQIADYLVQNGLLTNSELQAALGLFYLILITAALLLSIIATATSFLVSTIMKRFSK